MPMYYFSVRNGDTLQDTDGTDLPDADAAREHAIEVARELMMGSHGMLGRAWSEWTMTVRDSAGSQILSFALADFNNPGLEQ